MILSDRILGRDNAWAGLFDPHRIGPLAAAPRLLEEGARTGLRFVGDRLTKRGTRALEELAPGEGDIVRHRGEKVAGHRRDDGSLVAVGFGFMHFVPISGWLTAALGLTVSASIIAVVLGATWVPARHVLRVTPRDALWIE